MSSPDPSALDCVTVDAYGTLVVLTDPAPKLAAALEQRGVVRPVEQVERAFRAEVAYYRPRSLEGRDAATLLELRHRCVAVFLSELDADLDAASFADAFVGSLAFELTAGALAAMDALAAAGVELACVANWDCSLPQVLAGLGIADRFSAIVASAVVGVEKPDPEIFRLALAHVGADPARSLHVGDEEVDRAGAAGAGLAFLSAPLATVPSRLGLR
jgi:putative hydrolase of the HAD superfamily